MSQYKNDHLLFWIEIRSMLQVIKLLFTVYNEQTVN